MHINSNISNTGQVEKYIGSAYDKMAELHANLADLLVIAESIKDGSFDEVASIADEIQGLIDKIDLFNSTYYGALDYIPVVDPLGNQITDGDIYFDINKKLMYVFVDGFWIPLGAANNTVTRVQLADSHFNGDSILVPVGIARDGNPYMYLPGQNNMTVHLNGLLLVGTHTSPLAGSYTETSETEITINNLRLSQLAEIGDEVVFHIGTEAATVTHIGAIGRYVYTTIQEGETVITLPTGVSYIRGANNINVHVKLNKGDAYDRGLQLETVDYNEVSPIAIQFTRSLPALTEVTITIGHIVANDDAHFEIIMTIGKPNEMDYDEGQLWFRTDTGRMYILYFDDVPDPAPESGQPWTNRQWISITPEDSVIGPDYVATAIPPSPVIHGTIFQDTAPNPYNHAEGTLWFNIKTGNLHIKYQDLDSQQWVKVST